MVESSNIFKAIERERWNFADEIFPYEEGRSLDWLGIVKDCFQRRKMKRKYNSALLKPKNHKGSHFHYPWSWD